MYIKLFSLTEKAAFRSNKKSWITMQKKNYCENPHPKDWQ
jgi:hypothetical protein